MKKGRLLVARVVRAIEETPWDDAAIRGKWLDYFCWVIITVGGAYFAAVCLRALTR